MVPHPALGGLTGEGLGLSVLGIGLTVRQGDDKLAGRAESELMIGAQAPALDFQVLAKDLEGVWVSTVDLRRYPRRILFRGARGRAASRCLGTRVSRCPIQTCPASSWPRCHGSGRR